MGAAPESLIATIRDEFLNEHACLTLFTRKAFDAEQNQATQFALH